ncbi:hypothetical protein DL96DRAFT_1495288 [Flagelloscypha sp. PMI_526]|nr:hypothetical protein DL96DRAFT_1495288 [Flagelloscypha sp. PMI_526]
MDSILELQRQSHEDIERFEQALSGLLSQQATVRAHHVAADILERTHNRIHDLANVYQNTAARDKEIQLIAGSTDLDLFYSRLAALKEHHIKYPTPASGVQSELDSLLRDPEQDPDFEFADEDPIALLFSGEEAYGKYLDLYANHVAYSNLKGMSKRPGYLQYLDILLASQDSILHQDLTKDVRHTKDYETYIQALHNYLVSFVRRTKPLEDIGAQERDSLAEFVAKWEQKDIPGWDAPEANSDGSTGIWCAACQKHYSKQTVYDAHLTSKKHVKAAAKLEAGSQPAKNPNGSDAPQPANLQPSALQTRLRNAAQLTYLTTLLLRSLVSTLNDTKANVERRFSLTAREREQELIEQAKPQAPPPKPAEDGEAEPEEDEEEERIYNPLKLPLGWDGKPIPYWLYKLHGLGVEYRCEICSDHVYMGRFVFHLPLFVCYVTILRKNFDRHFQESRHAFGMRALGLPNTKHFHEITSIKDALTLAEKLKKEGKHEIFEQETMEELEDDEGNVYNRKTYEDLKKQGLI